MTLDALDPTTHVGLTATVPRLDGDGHWTGRLSYARGSHGTPHWWLIVPNPGTAPFAEVAVSLQWGTARPVVLHDTVATMGTTPHHPRKDPP